jgi:hypothetical protein
MDRIRAHLRGLSLLMLGSMLAAGCALARPDAQDSLPGDPHHRLSRATVAALFQHAPRVHEDGGVTHVYVRCTVAEGAACDYATPVAAAAAGRADDPDARASDGPMDRDSAERLVIELGVQHVERAQDATVLLDCRREADVIDGCAIHGGGRYWYPVTLIGPPPS